MTLPYTMPGRLAWQAEHRGSAVALREKRLGVWEEITWEGYRNRMADVARMLEELGVGPGDHVGILSDNRTECR